MNTRIRYLYRDGNNFKNINTFIVRGEITESQKRSILSALDENEYFIPSQVRMPETRFDEITDDDHAWFELDDDGFELTEEDPDTIMSVEELTELFLTAAGNWDESSWNEQ